MNIKHIELLRGGLKEFSVPSGLHDGLIRYIAYRIPTGAFLRSILENNLKVAVCLADPINQTHLTNIIGFLEHWAPEECWGSPERVTEWLRNRPIPKDKE